jgi:hypothetical protein
MGLRLLEGDLDTIGVDIQYAKDDGVSAPTTISQQVDLLAMDTPVYITITEDLDGQYWWRARLVFGGSEMPWTDTWRFTVDTTAGDTTVALTATVTTTVDPDPQLWFANPGGGVPGDRITLYGQGLPTTGTVTVGDTPMTVISWGQVPATSNALTADRTISLDVVDPEHDEIVVIIPDGIDMPGDQLVVAGA